MATLATNSGARILTGVVLAQLALLSAIPGSWGARLCCAPGVGLGLQRSRACDDGNQVPLNCSHIYIINPEEEPQQPIFHANNSLSIGEVTYEPHEYCMAHMYKPDSPLQTRSVALACGSDQYGYADDPDDDRPYWWSVTLSAASWLSVCCLALTLAAHLVLPQLRDLQGRCHMAAVSSLGLGLLLLNVLQDGRLVPPEGAACTALACLEYYWLLSAFFWLNITSFNVWRSVAMPRVHFSERSLFRWYCVVGWGAPLALLAVLLTIHNLPGEHDLLRPELGVTTCWFSEEQATWAYFYGPCALLISLNVVYFVWTTARLWHQYNETSLCRPKILKERLILSLKLFLIMGVSWVFELLSSATDSNHVAWYAADMFNTLQGVLILVLLVLCRRRVWRAVDKLRPCGWRPPERWAARRDDSVSDTTDSECDEDDERVYELKDMTGRSYVSA